MLVRDSGRSGLLLMAAKAMVPAAFVDYAR
jgi:hypothetical protein